MRSGDGSSQKLQVAHRARQRTDRDTLAKDSRRSRELGDMAGPRDQAIGRFEPEDPAEVRRDADRSGGIRPDLKWREPGSDASGSTAGASTGRTPKVSWVGGSAVEVAVAIERASQLGHVALAHEDRSRRLEASDDDSIFRWHVMLEWLMARGGPHTSGLERVFDRERHAVQRSEGVAPLHCEVSLGSECQCSICVQRDNRVEGRVVPLDARQMGLDNRASAITESRTDHRLEGPCPLCQGGAGEPKTGPRSVPIPPVLVDILREWRDTNRLTTPERLLFRTRNDTTPSGSNWARSWHRALESVGQQPMRVYDCHHATATTWLRAGMPLAETARRLGHSVETPVSTYIDALNDEEHIDNQRIDVYPRSDPNSSM